MNVTPTALPDVLAIGAWVFGGSRGFFKEPWPAVGHAALWVPERGAQENILRAVEGSLRGLHFRLAWQADLNAVATTRAFKANEAPRAAVIGGGMLGVGAT